MSDKPRRKPKWALIVLIVAAVAVARRRSRSPAVGDTWPPVPRAPGVPTEAEG